MATFDFSRLEVSSIVLSNPVHACAFQNMVRDFMAVVRDHPQFFEDKARRIDEFINIVQYPGAWVLASMVVPEFRRPQNYQPTERSPMTRILNATVDLRPPVPHIDPTLSIERDMIVRRLADSIMYLVTGGKGWSDATQEQQDLVNTLTDMVLNAAHQS